MIAILCLALSFNFVESASQIQESARRVLQRNWCFLPWGTADVRFGPAPSRDDAGGGR